jgi:type IV pilus assembly protein PilB
VNLGELLVDEGVLGAGALAEVQAEALRQDRALVGLIVEQRLVAEDVIADVVARAVGTVVIDVDLGALDKEAVQLVPEGVARRYLLIPLSKDGDGARVRVALANPLDEGAVAAVREATHLEVEPMVATVSGLRAAIDREYRTGNTAVIRAPSERSELPREDTRQMDAGDRSAPRTSPGTNPMGTAPMHRLEHEAPMEQRHEALLLTLIDAGVLTRSDYIAALRRLKGRK